MNAPKISVLIPLYNRKHYIAQAIDSVMAQTFQDYEVIVRDDGSTDGSADFVEERYATEIFLGKLKLRRNEKNIGEFPTDNRLLNEAAGKYIMLLHSDDMYLPHALEYMYGLAEKYNADVVHGSVCMTTASDGVIKEDTPFKIKYNDKHHIKDISVMTNDPFDRFNKWVSDIGIDAQHNIFNRQFLIDNDLCFESFGGSLTGGNRLLALKWLMRAKVIVKTPKPFYIYRNAPDSRTRSKFPPELVAQLISEFIELSRYLDKFFATDDFFKDKPEMQYRARSNLFTTFNNHWIRRNGVYRKGVTPELHQAVEEAFKKHFAEDAVFPTFLFHWYNTLEYKNFLEYKKSLNKVASPSETNS